MPRQFSGRELVQIFSSKYGFEEVGISGSHMKLRRKVDGMVITIIIPLHKEVFVGTFHSILRQAKVEKKDFMEKSGE